MSLLPRLSGGRTHAIVLLLAVATVASLPAAFPPATVGAAAPTLYLAPLKAHQAKLAGLRGEIGRLQGLAAPATAAAAKTRAADIRKAGADYLAEAQAFSRTVSRFIAGGTRRGLDVEVGTIRTTIGQVLATVDSYRAISGAPVQKPTAETPSLLEQTLRSALATQIARRIPDKLVAEGVRQIISGTSVQTVLKQTLDQARQKAYSTVDSQVRSVTGLGLHDLRDLGRAVQLRANMEVDRLFTRLLVRATSSALVIDLVRQFALPWVKAQLTALMRPHRTIEQRVALSIKSLERAASRLNGLSPTARLSTVHARWRGAQASLAATKLLVADLKRTHQEGLLAGDYGEALTAVERAMSLAETRFLLHKEDLVRTLAVDRDQLKGMLGDLRYLVNHVRVEAPTVKSTLEAELTRGSWTFGRVNGAVLCTVTFTKTPGKYGAYVLKACHPNESYWKLEGRTLSILHADGTKTSRLTRVSANYWQGPYLGHLPDMPSHGTVHYIKR